MSIEAMRLAIEAWDACGRYPDSTSDIERLDAAVNALHTAIQQAEAQQPDTRLPEDVVIGHVTLCKGSNISLLIDHAKRLNADVERLEAQQPATASACGIPGMAKTTCPYCEQGFAFEHEQPATGEPVVSRNPFASRCYTMSESHLSGHRLIVGFEKLGDAQDAHEWVARQGRGDFTHQAPSVPMSVSLWPREGDTMTELEVKQTCWAYLVEHGYPTTGRWSFYGGHWNHAEPRKEFDDVVQAEDRKLLIAQIKRIGVNWEATQMPEFDLRSEFVGTDCDSNDTRTMIGLLVLNDGKMVKLGCHGQPEHLEDLAAHIEQLTKDSERARSIFGVGTP